MRPCLLLLLAVEATALADQNAGAGASGPFQRSTGFRTGIHRIPKPDSEARSAPKPDGSGLVQSATALTITALRVGTCVLAVHHGVDKLNRTDGFSANVVAKSFGFLPGSPKLWTYAAAAAQVLGSGFLGIGLFSRPAALSMCGTMVAAVAYHLRNTGVEGFPLGSPPDVKYKYELASMYLLVLLYFTAAGAGSISVDEIILGGELAFYTRLYKGAWARVTGRRGRRAVRVASE